MCVTVVARRQRTRSEIECLVDCNNTLPHCGAITFYDGECQMSINTTTTRCVGQTVITYIKYEGWYRVRYMAKNLRVCNAIVNKIHQR